MIKNSLFISDMFFSRKYFVLLRLLALKMNDLLKEQNDQPNIEQQIFPSLQE
jgi:hypothetical protein